MGKASTKENKNRYFQAREDLGLTRAEASELLEVISEDRVEKIENERIAPQPYDVLAMARAYKKPSLCNYYCSHECPIGKEYVPEVEVFAHSSNMSNMYKGRVSDMKTPISSLHSSLLSGVACLFNVPLRPVQ